MKEQVDTLDATPSKRLYLSIIADYDLYKAVCELVDNAVDIWTLGKRSSNLNVTVTMDINQQRIDVVDDAGGIAEKDLTYIVAPGQTLNPQAAETIGIFGVGTKRAVVALSQEVKIRTRQKEGTYQVEIDDSWINQADNWDLPVFRVSDISEGTTQIELLKLRKRITDITISKLKYHLSATYAIFLKDERLCIVLNGDRITPLTFDNWAYPPDYLPTIHSGELHVQDGKTVHVLVITGLTLESNDASGEYGVYFYCNDRLVARALKTLDVGFGLGLAGKPSEEISLARIIVQLNGEARFMPWNSSKSDIDTENEVFVALQNWLSQIVKHTTGLSRRMRSLDGGWNENVFKYPSGSYVEVNVDDFPSANVSYLPPLPETMPRYAKVVQQENKTISSRQPWTTGLYESLIAVDWILKTKLEQRNRIALILLDSTLEIAFKEYLVNNTSGSYSDKRLAEIFNDRKQVHTEIKRYVKISKTNWGKIVHFYEIRSHLIHRKASVSISDREIEQFRSVVEAVLRKMYGLRFPRQGGQITNR
jgi:hypothetical protein